ncbi:interleukin-15 isoform X1 [Nannospalax galili]|uniref:interleukin-15 isoform X1 n=1 Tax=Nannospalax galili TaxID=1026970 RepID=UPI000819A7F0|nr:interleukin-15 isoform X1 [Nannospalax galili]XP_017656192.1 interleukin-15 isoform X1 [Nannospalax galili]
MGFTPKAYALGSSQLGLLSCTHFSGPAAGWPLRPTLLTTTSVSVAVGAEGFPFCPFCAFILSGVLLCILTLAKEHRLPVPVHFPRTLSSVLRPAGGGARARGALRLRQSCPSPRNRCLAAPNQLRNRKKTCPTAPRLSSASNSAQQGQERIHYEAWSFGSLKQCLSMVHAGDALWNTEAHVSR